MLSQSIEQNAGPHRFVQRVISLMVYSFARIGAAVGMKVEDVFIQNRRLWVRLHEKGGKEHKMPCHHNLEQALVSYIDGAGLAADPKGSLFRTIGRGTSRLTRTSLPQANAHAMIRRRAAAAGIETKIGNHSFRATGITAYLKNGGTLEKAAAMAKLSTVGPGSFLFLISAHAITLEDRLCRIHPPQGAYVFRQRASG